MITGLAHVCFTVRDLDRSLAFYCDGLGFSKAFDFVRESGERYGAYISAGPRVFIELFAGEHAASAESPSFRHICLEVDDIESTVAELHGKGIAVGNISLGLDNTYQAWLTDPDGNRIELHAYTENSRQKPWLR